MKRFKGQNVTFHTIFDLLAFEEFSKITSSKSLMKYISTFMSMEPECLFVAETPLKGGMQIQKFKSKKISLAGFFW